MTERPYPQEGTTCDSIPQPVSLDRLAARVLGQLGLSLLGRLVQSVDYLIHNNISSAVIGTLLPVPSPLLLFRGLLISQPSIGFRELLLHLGLKLSIPEKLELGVSKDPEEKPSVSVFLREYIGQLLWARRPSQRPFACLHIMLDQPEVQSQPTIRRQISRVRVKEIEDTTSIKDGGALHFLEVVGVPTQSEPLPSGLTQEHLEEVTSFNAGSNHLSFRTQGGLAHSFHTV